MEGGLRVMACVAHWVAVSSLLENVGQLKNGERD